ncbi:MAG: recombinase RecT [Oscillospiraceae bacterium]
MSNEIQKSERPKKMTFSLAIETPSYQKMINTALKDPARVGRFVAGITSAVSVNPDLQICDPATVLSGALLGESLELSPSPQLGQYYLVPFNNTQKGCKDAQFVLGYKGYIQLALRSGCYADLDCIEIHQGEYLGRDAQTGKQKFKFIEDDDQREELPVIGYLAYFEYLNGFRKSIYWTRQKVEKHALRYSKGYAAKKGYTFWEKDFDAMAFKTILRQLISKWGIMSIEMQKALEADMGAEQNLFDVPEQKDNSPEHIQASFSESDMPTVETAQEDKAASISFGELS